MSKTLKLLKRKRSRRVFAPSMSDPFHPAVKDEWLDQFMATVALTSHITYQVLTKRPERMLEYFSKFQDWQTHLGEAGEWASDMAYLACDKNWRKFTVSDGVECSSDETYEELMGAISLGYLQNLHLGVTAENQAAANDRIPYLQRLGEMGYITFVSVEPMLEEIDLREFLGSGIRQTQRRNDLPTCIERRVGDRRARTNLESRQEGMGQMESLRSSEQMPKGQGRNNNGEVSSYQCNVQSDGVSDGSAQIGVSPFLRQNSRRNDDQPQRWEQEKQSSIQPRASNILGANYSCLQNGLENTIWREEPRKQADKSTNRGNTGNVCSGESDSEANCGYLRGEASDDFKNSEGRSEGNACGNDSGLYSQTATQGHEERCDGQILLCIIGGESGPNARPFHLEWAQSLIDQCYESNVKVFMKQVGSNAFYQGQPFKTKSRAGSDPSEWPEWARVQEFPVDK